MSLFDKVKGAGDKASKSMAKSYQEHQEKVAKVKDARGDKIEVLSLDYMGGYGDMKKVKGKLTFYQKQTEFSSPLSTKFTIPNTTIADVAIEGKNEVHRRITVTRLLAVGIFAFLIKKKNKDKEAYITLVLSDGQEVIFFVDDKSPMELKTKLARVILLVKQASTASQAQATQQATQGSVSIADELTKLASLKEQGIMTQAEFDDAKARILSQ